MANNTDGGGMHFPDDFQVQFSNAAHEEPTGLILPVSRRMNPPSQSPSGIFGVGEQDPIIHLHMGAHNHHHKNEKLHSHSHDEKVATDLESGAPLQAQAQTRTPRNPKRRRQQHHQEGIGLSISPNPKRRRAGRKKKLTETDEKNSPVTEKGKAKKKAPRKQKQKQKPVKKTKTKAKVVTCKFRGCKKSSQGSDCLCKSHGGGKRCKIIDCNKHVVSSGFAEVMAVESVVKNLAARRELKDVPDYALPMEAARGAEKPNAQRVHKEALAFVVPMEGGKDAR
eukprot:CAMPEP_0204835434 /NCGR_PEP_ID=MMETSP1346-20131115/22612_1 /ASSEMBLY_ACC=CAM_ASM_000771 /TAXON_ID=215587 /ORGANISM="Aplanochytrium stocchinoi, Strain GSBS06" /LENGTH=280 /DNA_ID=CAMNT_0051969459 /DNA_START=238 /DNA_END=1081 /DNA_ORIENTATION=-